MAEAIAIKFARYGIIHNARFQNFLQSATRVEYFLPSVRSGIQAAFLGI
jgi:hypothetical protein